METNQGVSIGTPLHLRESEYNRTIHKAETEVVPVINAIAKAYSELGMVEPFYMESLFEFLEHGVGKTRTEFEQMAKRDLQGHESPIAIKAALREVDNYMQPLVEAINNLQEVFKMVNRSAEYRLTIKDFSIKNGKAVVNKSPIKDHFTISIKSETQLRAYNQFLKYIEEHNKTVNLLQSLGIQLPFTGLLGSGISSRVREYSDEIQLNPAIFEVIK